MLGEGVGGRCWLVAVLCALCFSVFGGVAFGAGTYELVGSIGGIEFPEGLAVDQATGDVYVVDFSNASVARFDASGKFAPFSASEGYIQGNRLIDPPGEEFAFDFSAGSAAVAVDGSTGPASGDLYVTDSHREAVEVFASSGEFLGDVDTASASPLSGGEPCGVAVDGAGNVFIGWSSGHVDEYTPTNGDPAEDSFVHELENVGEVCGVGAETGGITYAEVRTEGMLLGFEQSEYGLLAPVPISVGSGVGAFDVNPADGHLFAAEGGSVIERTNTGEQVGQPFGAFESVSGLAVKGTSGRVYVSAAQNGGERGIDIFEVPKPGKPVVGGEFSANVASASAELGGEINPELLETTYHFEYGTDMSYAGGVVPAVPGAIQPGRALQQVTASLTGLQAGVTYHYRVIATNAMGSTVGADRTFTTFAQSSFSLPDDRGWEMVSPVEKNGGQVGALGGLPLIDGGVLQAAPDGESVTYDTLSAFGGEALGAPLGNQYLASRAPTGWSSKDLVTLNKAGSFNISNEGAPYVAASEDLGEMLQISGNFEALSPPLSPLAPAGFQNYYLRDTASDLLQPLLTSVPADPTNFYLEFEGSSPDLEHVVVRSAAALTPGAVYASSPNLYEWSATSGLAAVNVLPGALPGETTPSSDAELGSGLGGSNADTTHAVSDDGSRVFFSDLGNLYVREDADSVDARTVLIAGVATFLAADSSGSKVFYSSCGDLWEFDTASETSRDLTVVEGRSCNGGVQGMLSASNDGSYVYFVADGSLTPGAPTGNCNSAGSGEECGLYALAEGRLSFVGTLSQGDESDWVLGLVSRTARVSADGRHVVFVSSSSDLTRTGYDNLDAHTNLPDSEVYEYTVGGSEAVCVSCNPTGGRPSGSSSIPGGTPYHAEDAVYESRVVSSDGSRVFFDSRDALSLQDSNNKGDVYEYEGGHEYLISSGSADEDATFADASESGNDVFFVTDAQLVGQDTDQLPDLYDARVGGGLPAPTELATPCVGEGCRAPATVPLVFGAPASATSTGPGNVVTHPVTKKKAKPKAKKKKAKKKKQGNGAKPKVRRGSRHGKSRARGAKRAARAIKGRG
jgi:hypothetical protein